MQRESFLSRLSPSGLFPTGESLLPDPIITVVELKPKKKPEVRNNAKKSSGVTNQKFVHKIPKSRSNFSQKNL